jgi:hypothetical protein
MRSQANDLMSSLDRDKPFPYTSLTGLLIKINLFIMSTWKGVQWSIWLRTFGDDIWQQPKFYADILVLLSWNVSYAALFDLSQTLHNPFKFRRIDVAHETISKGIRQLGVALMGPGNLPPEAPTPSFVGTYATIRHHYPTILPPGWVQGVAQVQAPYPRPSPYVAIQDL